MKIAFASAVLILSAQALSGATFAVLPDLTVQPIREAYAFTTESTTWIAAIRTLIAEGKLTTPAVRIAPGQDAVNRNHLAAGAPFWNWRVLEIVDLLPAGGPVIPVIDPRYDTPLSVIDDDVEGFIAEHGDVIAPRWHARLVEINPDDLGRLVNVSSRGVLGSGDRVLISGFIVQGTTPRLVLVRALGPKLADYGVSGAAENPALILFRGQKAIARNDDWGTSPGRDSIPPGLEPLHPKDAAIIVILEPGAYTLHAASPDEGIGLVDVFDLTAMK